MNRQRVDGRARVLTRLILAAALLGVGCTSTAASDSSIPHQPSSSAASTRPEESTAVSTEPSPDTTNQPTTSSTEPPALLADVTNSVQALLDASLRPGALDWTLHDVLAPATGASVAIRVRGQPDLILSSGTELDLSTPFNSESVFSASTIASSMTQDLAFQLIREGVLDPAATLSTWFPDYPNAGHITVEMLLDESNGMGDFDARETELILADPNRAWTLDAVLAESANQPTTGEPGVFQPTSHATGIIAIGRIMELVTGTSLKDLYRTRITEPLGMRHTALSDGSPTPGLQPGLFALGGAPANTADYPRTAYTTFGSPVWGVDSTVTDLLTYLSVAVNGSPTFGTKLTPANFPASRLNETGALVNGTGTGLNGFCPCEPTSEGMAVSFIGRGPNSVGTTIQMYDYVQDGVSIVVHYNSSEIESFEQIHPMVEQIEAMVAPYAT